MSFQESVDSPLTKLHLHSPKRLLLVGIILVSILVAGVLLMSGIFTNSSGVIVVDHEDSSDVPVEQERSMPEESAEADVTTEDALSNNTKTETDKKICVHVEGCVVNPGVYWLSESSRVDDALMAAGGVTEQAASDAINRARLLQDGEQVVVYSIEEAQAGLSQASSPSMHDGGSASRTQAPQAKVNINTADQALLETLPGIGAATAQKIITYREQQGRFASPEDLKNVSGIGEKKYEALADIITVS